MSTPETWHAGSCAPRASSSHATNLKTHHGFERMCLRGLSGARDEFYLAAIVQNLKTLANHVWRPPPDAQAAFVV
jgi:hypothetical protein